MIRILHVIGSMDCGGAESLIMDIFRGIDKNKIMFDFAVHTTKKGYFDDEIKLLGGRIYYFTKFNGFNRRKYKKEWDIFLTKHPEYTIIHGHIGSSAALYLGVAKKHGLYTIAHSHSAGFDKTIRGLGNRFFSFKTRFVADYFFGCSGKAGLNTYGKKVFNDKNKYSPLINGINTDKYFIDKSARDSIRAKYCIPNDALVIGNVGRLTYAKNHPYLLNVFRELSLRGIDCYLLLVGDGDYKQKIIDLSTKYGIKEKVILTGFVSDVEKYLNAMDFYVFPSFYEGLPISVVEAQANGLCCLISDTITKEVCLTDLVTYFSIKNNPNIWCDFLINNLNYYRKARIDDIKKSGFDIIETISFLETFYLDKYNRIGELKDDKKK